MSKAERHERRTRIAERQRELREIIDENGALPFEESKQLYYDLNWLLNEADTLERIRAEVERP